MSTSSIRYQFITTQNTKDLRDAANSLNASGKKSNVPKYMTKDGSIIDNAAKPAQTATKTGTSSYAELIQAISLLNDLTPSSGGNAGNPTAPVASPQPMTSAPSNEDFSRVSGNSSSTNSSTSYRLPDFDSATRVINNPQGYSADALEEYIQTNITPNCATVNSALANTQGQHNLLLSEQATAEADVTRLESQIGTVSEQRDSAKTSWDTNKSDLNSSVKTRDQMDEQLSSVNSEYKTVCDDVKQKEAAKGNSQTSVSQSKSANTKAESDLQQATLSCDNAKSILDATPQTLEDNTPNPQYEAAKSAYEAALKCKEDAQKSLDSAKEALGKSEESLKNAEQELTTAQENKQNKVDELKKAESSCKSLADKCDKLQDIVENNQETYDNSLKVYDESNNNYERINSELESAQGILTQCKAYESQLESLKSSTEIANNLQTKGKAEVAKKREQEAKATAQVMENADATEGCSAYKTPAENLMSLDHASELDKDFLHKRSSEILKDARPLPNLPRMMPTCQEQQLSNGDRLPVIKRDAQWFGDAGFIANSDGSMTHPGNGMTYVQTEQERWVATNALDSKRLSGSDLQAVFQKYPDLKSTIGRMEDQKTVYVENKLGINTITIHMNYKNNVRYSP